MRCTVGALIFAGLSGPAFAFDYGRWLAPDVSIPAMGNQSPALADYGSPLFWIKASNNQIMATNPANVGVNIWRPNDTITICNGSLCESWVYLANGNLVRKSFPYKDNGRGYKNSSVNLVVGSAGSWDAVFSINYDYSWATQAVLPKVASVTVRPVEAAAYGYGDSLSMGFDWGGATSSDAFLSSQGGNCYNSHCVNAF